MIFKDYSQTYAADITALAGMIAAAMPVFGIEVPAPRLQFLIGLALNLGGVIWALKHRYNQGDITPFGKRI
jgi:hypothetical protein